MPTVRKLLHEGGSVHETTEEGESLLSLACSAGYYELAQVRVLSLSSQLLKSHLMLRSPDCIIIFKHR